MEDNEILISIAGVVTPFILGVIRRYIPLTQLQAYATSFVVCLLISVIYQLTQNNFNYKVVLTNFASIYALTQLVYTGLKGSGAIDKLEGI